MASGYSKQLIVDAFLHRFRMHNASVEKLEPMANSFYDEVGKDKFRVYASVDAAVIREYKEFLKNGDSYPRRV